VASWPIVGHEWALALLQQAVISGRLSHAYLFSGPGQVGKTTIAKAFAQALCCERASGVPCGECRTCQRILQGRYPDVQYIAADKNAIQIDQIRLLQSDAALSPLEGRYKVFIVREIERATLPAANALLKTLEEPPPQVLLLLTSARRDQVLPTVVSRCQIIGLRPLPLEQVRAALETRWGVDGERAALLARLSAGRLGWAVSVHNDPELWTTRARTLDQLLALTEKGYRDRLAYAEQLSRRRDIVESTLELWVTWWRDVLFVQRGLPDAIVNLDRRIQLTQQAGVYHPEQVEGALVDLVQTLRRLRANVNVRLALDVLTLRLPKPLLAPEAVHRVG
jgi:DNA polymerase-3 subunit delta'